MQTRQEKQSNRHVVRHANGQTTSYIYDSFVDPWRPAETVLLQHGFARTSAHLYHWVPALARHYNVIRRDLRGHGSSSYPKEGDNYDYSTATIIEEIKDMLDQLNIDKIHFIGESTSGMVAEIFAATHPERTSSVIVCSSPVVLPSSAQNFLAFGMESWPQACKQLGSRGWAERLQAASGTMTTDDASYAAWWTDEVAVSTGEGLAGYAEFLSKLDARKYLQRIECPVLVLCPTGSALVSVESMKELAASVQGARVEIVHSKGHEIYAEAADICIKHVLGFLNGIV
ncbi:hypothetical protein ACHAQA_005127 [Verticillium albo-atrum]